VDFLFLVGCSGEAMKVFAKRLIPIARPVLGSYRPFQSIHKQFLMDYKRESWAFLQTLDQSLLFLNFSVQRKRLPGV
jgi:hypothetical protein